MTKTIYLESLKSVPGRSILHYLPKVSHASPWEDRVGGGGGASNHLFIFTYYLSKKLKNRKKKVLVILNCFSETSLSISTFKCILD